MTMTTRKNARANNTRATMNDTRDAMRDAREYTSHDAMNDDEHAMMNAHNATCDDASHDDNDDALREYGNVLNNDATTNDDANITRARITRKLTKRDRAMLRKIARDENANVAHEHNTRWHDVVFDVRVLQKLNIEHRVID